MASVSVCFLTVKTATTLLLMTCSKMTSHSQYIKTSPHTMRMNVPRSSATNSFVDHPEKRREKQLFLMSHSADVPLLDVSTSVFVSFLMT